MELRGLPEQMISDSGRDLFDRCCSGDPLVVNNAYQQLGRYLLRVAYSRLQGKAHLSHLAEDCVQQALATIWQKLSVGRGPDHVEWFMSWCVSIVIHKVIDELRKAGRFQHESLDEPEEEGEGWPMLLPDLQAIAPDHYAIDNEFTNQWIAKIQNHRRLSEEAKCVLLYGFLLEWDDVTLAFYLKKERTSIRVIRFRTIQLLRDDPEFMSMLTSK